MYTLEHVYIEVFLISICVHRGERVHRGVSIFDVCTEVYSLHEFLIFMNTHRQKYRNSTLNSVLQRVAACCSVVQCVAVC